MHTKILVGNVKGIDHLGDLGIDGKIILEWVLREIGQEVVDWICFTQDGEQWPAVANVVMYFWVP
jgi:hypothetical protein